MAQATLSCPFGAIHLENRQDRLLLRGTLPGGNSSKPARVVQWIAPASAPLPLVGQWRKAIRLDQERAPGASSRRGFRVPVPDQTTWHKPGGPGRSSRLKPPSRQGPVARKERGMPLRVCPPEGTTCRRGLTKNGVLVPLPPWAKEPAAGAAESSFSCSFQGWKEPKIPGGWLRGVQALQSPAPGPPLRETLPGSISSHPARVVQSIAPASAPLPLVGQWRKAIRLDQERAPGVSSRRSWAVVAGGWGHPPLPPIRQPFRRGRCLIGPPGLGPAPERHFAFLS